MYIPLRANAEEEVSAVMPLAIKLSYTSLPQLLQRQREPLACTSHIVPPLHCSCWKIVTDKSINSLTP